MGLRMFREPDAVPTKTVIKADPTAPSRSTIRRQNNIRPRNNASSFRSRRVSPGLDRHSLFQIIQRDRRARDYDPITIGSERNRHGPVGGALADRERDEASNRRRLDHDRALLRDPLSYERPVQRRRHMRESALRYEMDSDVPPVVDPRPPRHPDHTDTALYDGPLSSPDSRRALPSATPQQNSTGHQSPDLSQYEMPESEQRTSRFAPAYRFHEREESYHIEEMLTSTSDNMRLRDSVQSSLRRNFSDRQLGPRRQNQGQPAFPYDIAALEENNRGFVGGLGDRVRSPSPEENQWETLLTTITPDEHLPSASSSFTSATASASTRSSDVVSANTSLLTAPSSTSDLLSASSNICEDMSDTSCSDSDDDYDAGRPLSQMSDQEILRRSRRNPSQSVDRLTTVSSRELSLELEQMRTILDRMERNEPVPDGWFIAAGLAENLRTAASAHRERERL